jgi:hypothetical protein
LVVFLACLPVKGKFYLYLAAEELAEIVMSAPEPAKLVFLSACESAKGAKPVS